jgi:hydrogenase maturation protein HypF
MAALAEPIEPGYGAALFHATVSQALGDWVVAYAHRSGADEVALGGGCFMNSILSTALRRYLSASGLRVLEANQAPPNDGGLALGQALVGLQHLLATREAISSTAC